MYSELIIMCNVIMTLYDAAVERRAGSNRFKLLVSGICKHGDLEAVNSRWAGCTGRLKKV